MKNPWVIPFQNQANQFEEPRPHMQQRRRR
jgi:hypothetical protein